MGVLSKSKKDEIIALFLERGEIGVSSIARELGVSKGLVSLALSELEGMKLIRRGKIDERKAEILKRILALRDLLEIDFSRIGRKFGLRGIGVFGSYVNGRFGPESDVDVWITHDKKLSQREIAVIREELKRALKRDIDLIVLDKGKLVEMKKKPSPLFYEILNSVIVWGDLF